MKQVRISVLVALAGVAIAAGLDHFFFSEAFGLAAYVLSAAAGLALLVFGLALAGGRLLFARNKNLVLGASLMLTGLLAFIFGFLLWLATGKPGFS